jgi:hypothetical protein
MRIVITTEKTPVKLWLDEPESGSLEQARNLANLPFTFSHVCLMPDAHQGYGPEGLDFHNRMQAKRSLRIASHPL